MVYPAQRSGPRRAFARPAEPPYPEDPTTATRHLCAAAYLDDTFRNVSLREVYYQTRRLVAPSYGFDLVPVLAHCLKARNGAVVRDAAIVVTFMIAACVSWVAVLTVLSIMGNLQAAVGTYRLARDAISRLRSGQPIALGTLVPRMFLVVLGWSLASFFGLLLASALVGQTTDSILQGGTGGFQDGTGGVETAATAALFGSLLLSLLIFAYPVAFSFWRQNELSRLTPGSRVTQPMRTARLDEIARQQRGNTVVYSGFRPFVGSGDLVDTWGFAQRLVRPAPSALDRLNGDARHAAGVATTERQREFAEPPFDAQEVVDYVRAHLSTLLPRREAEEQIAGLTVEDRVCLAGTEVSHLVPHTEPEVVAAVIRHPTTPARHYLACQVFAWGGELITTVYVHIAVQGRSLYLELSTTALPPCAEEFRIVDSVDGSGTVAWLRALRRGVVETPQTIWRAPAALTGALINLIASSGTQADATRLTRGYDYGARIGVRELGSSQDGMRNLVQLQDVEKFQKLIERRVIASVLDFLDERGVDTTEYRARAASVLSVNNNYGGVNVNTVGGNPTFNAPVAGRDAGAPGTRA